MSKPSRGGPRPGSRSRRPRDGQAKADGGFGPYRQRDERPQRGERRDGGRGASDARSQPTTTGGRSPLRIVGERQLPRTPGTRATAAAPVRRRRRNGPADVQQELERVAGRKAPRAVERLMAAAEAFRADRAREALRIVRPLRNELPDAPSVRELCGLAQYRVGNYGAAGKELEAFVELTDSVEQHPVLMDSYRAQRRWRKVDECWHELAAVSPSAELVAEGRIVYAGSLADRGRLEDALAVLRKRAAPVRAPREHHLRLWYALADLEERAGNLAAARDLFDRVRRAEPGFADVVERRAALA